MTPRLLNAPMLRSKVIRKTSFWGTSQNEIFLIVCQFVPKRYFGILEI